MLGSGIMGELRATPSVFPGALALGPGLVELGVLKNGLGSIQNLEILLKSIKVGQKLLFAAVAAVHADCAPMIASVAALSDSLIERGADADSVQQLGQLLRARLAELEASLASSVRSGRLLVSQRLKLENDLGRLSRDLVGALPLAGLLDRALGPRPLEPTPVELLHGSSAEAPEAEAVVATLALPASAAGQALEVDLGAGKTLIALAVALVAGGDVGRPVHVAFEAGTPSQTRITLQGPGEKRGPTLRIAALRPIGPSSSCARAAAASIGGSFEYERDASRATIYWPA